jgi:hypothetical protein
MESTEMSSLDGWTNTIGASRGLYPGSPLIQLLRFGTDVQIAALEGSDFAYNGVFLYGETETPLPRGSTLAMRICGGPASSGARN